MDKQEPITENGTYVDGESRARRLTPIANRNVIDKPWKVCIDISEGSAGF
jgi:hypothetical protein